MLSPRDRSLLLESLRPPVGYRLDRAFGTTYTLDLLALLTAPLAFTFFDWEDEEGRPSAEPLALFEAVRRHADRITVFCQAGAVQLPRTAQVLLGWIEECVVEVKAPHPKGIFHPKVWVLRYTAEDEPVVYRLLCLSRNLTFDRSWDTAVVLDGELRSRKRAIAGNRPLSEFVAALPGLAVRDAPDSVQASAELMSSELLRVSWELPEGFDEHAFHPLGHSKDSRRPFPEALRRCLVVAPFLDEGFLRHHSAAMNKSSGIVSRAESLERLPAKALENFESVFVLAAEADPEDDEDDGGSPGERLCGLHAKLFIQDDGWHASVFSGSANATTAAFERNVEFLVELRGKKSRCGVRAFLAGSKEKQQGMGDLLVPWSAQHLEPDPEQAKLEALERKVERYAHKLAEADLRLVAALSEFEDAWSLRVVRSGHLHSIPLEAEISCWPSSVPDTHAAVFSRSGSAASAFEALSFEALTSFIAFEIALEEGGLRATKRFVLNLPATGFPDDRRDRLLRSLLKDRDQVLRLLWLLLSSEQVSVEQVAETATGSGKGTWRTGGLGGIPLLEAMLLALERDPARLDDVERLIEDLARSEEGRELLPEGLDALWDPIRRVRKALVQ